MSLRPFDSLDHPQQFVGIYGKASTSGVLSEHVNPFQAAGGIVRPAASGSGAQWAVVDGYAYPVVCSELVRVDTEDGPVSGRCGSLATREGSCEYHAEQREGWAAQSEAEVVAWERAMDEAGA